MKLRRQKSARRVFATNGAGRPIYNAYWNGERCTARRVVVIVGAVEMPTWWCAGLVGQERAAVEVTYNGTSFLLDDADGAGWRKVTEGMGSPAWGHANLPAASLIIRERAA